MQHNPFLDISSETITATDLRVLASLTADTATYGRRALIHLAQVNDERAGAEPREPFYAVGLPKPADAGAGGESANNVSWSIVGQIDLHRMGPERVLLAGLSVVAMKQVRESELQIGDAVLVLGHNPWSLLLLQWAKLQGASPLVFAARGATAVAKLASSMGVEVVLDDPEAREIARTVKLCPRGAGFAIALDGIATEQSLAEALPALRDGGRYLLAGLDPEGHVDLDAYPDVHRRDLEIVSPMHSPGDLDFGRMCRFALQLADQRRLRLDGLLDSDAQWNTEVRHTY